PAELAAALAAARGHPAPGTHAHRRATAGDHAGQSLGHSPTENGRTADSARTDHRDDDSDAATR
ncbi:hypothetical protein, partial [Streptomyces sp. JJ38]|uniref:hypothetical protein n=1 Tax=Streptomyces sp. JJ38 TaxID=2738128 RepID=UPI001C579029